MGVVPIQFLRGTLTTLLAQSASVAYGLVLPRMLIVGYGSEVNGVVASALQMVGFLAILEAGLSTASIRQLFAPIASSDASTVTNIMSSTRRYFYQVAVMAGLFGVFAGAVYAHNLDSSLSLGMMLALIWAVVLGPTLDFALTSKYLVFYTATEQISKYQTGQIIATVAKICIASLSSHFDGDVRIMLLLIGLMPVLKAGVLRILMRRGSPVFMRPYEKVAIEGRWAVLAHQSLGLVTANTPTLIIGVVLNAVAVSMFSVYYMIFGVFTVFSWVVIAQVVLPRLGALLVSDEPSTAVRLHERVIRFSALGGLIAIASSWSLIAPFLQLYLDGADQDYYQKDVAVAFGWWTLLLLLKAPFQLLVTAAGKFRETVWISTLEALVYIVVLAASWDTLSIVTVVISLSLGAGAKALLLTWYCNRRLLRISSETWIVMLLVVASMVVLSTLGAPVVSVDSVFSWLILALLAVSGASALAGILLLLVTGLGRVLDALLRAR